MEYKRVNGLLLLLLWTSAFNVLHLSKGPSGRKQKCTQILTPFAGTVFHALSQGVIHFVQSVSFKNLKIEVFDWLLKNFNQRVVSQANTPNKMDHAKWKSIRNCAQKWCWKLCAFLFEVTWAFGKMWYGARELQWQRYTWRTKFETTHLQRKVLKSKWFHRRALNRRFFGLQRSVDFLALVLYEFTRVVFGKAFF